MAWDGKRVVLLDWLSVNQLAQDLKDQNVFTNLSPPDFEEIEIGLLERLNQVTEEVREREWCNWALQP